MRIDQETLDRLETEGITVRPSVQTQEEYLQMVHDNYVKRYKDTCDQNDIDKLAWNHADWCMKHVYWEQAKNLFIFDDETIYQRRNMPVFKKLSYDYVMSIVKRERKKYAGYYGDFAKKMQRLVKEELRAKHLAFQIYPTTYGIGVWHFFNFEFKKDCSAVTSVMDKYGIEYENEYSDKFYIYRFKVRKDKANLAKLG